MARKMRKFSAGGAQGKYDRRMADIKKDFEKDSAGKSGKALEVLQAKRAQRTADAEDDRAKRTGADRTATRAAEKAAEANLTKTRKYGAAKSVSTEAPAAKVTDSLPTPKMDSSIGKKSEAKPPVRRPVAKPSAADTARSKFFQDSLAKSDFKRTALGASNLPSDQGFSSKQRGSGASKDSKSSKSGTSSALMAPKGSTSRSGPSFGDMFKTSDTFRKAQEAKYGKRTPLISGTDTNALLTYGEAAAKKNAANKAKGGKIMKYAKGGSTPSRPMPMGGKQLMPMKKKPVKEPITGGADTVPLTPGRKEFLKEMAKRNAKPGMAKGGSASCGMAKGGKATKFGAAMKKKSADTKGRAMMKFAKGGSIDGCAVKGKTKTSMVKMKKGGSC